MRKKYEPNSQTAQTLRLRNAKHKHSYDMVLIFTAYTRFLAGIYTLPADATVAVYSFVDRSLHTTTRAAHQHTKVISRGKTNNKSNWEVCFRTPAGDRREGKSTPLTLTPKCLLRCLRPWDHEPVAFCLQLDKLFSLFDFDGSASLNDVEAEMMIECVVRG